MSEQPLPFTLLNWEQVYELCRELAEQLRAADFRIDMLIAIARGGYVPGRILSDILGIHDLTGFKIEHYHGFDKHRQAFVKYPLSAAVAGKNILLLDDVSDTGDTFIAAVDHLRSRGADGEIRSAALHFKTGAKFVPDFYAATLSEWRWLIYPWALNEDLSAIIAKIPAVRRNPAELQTQIAQHHGINVTLRQIEDALLLLQQHR